MAGASRTASSLVISRIRCGSAPPPLRDEELLSEATGAYRPWAMGGRLSVFICALVATLVIGIGTPGSANVINRSDGNDTKGPLDLARLKVAHAGGAHVFQLTTIGSFSNKDANGTNGLFEIGIDTNADRRFNYYIDVFFAAGRFRGVLLKPNGTVITYDEVAVRVSRRSVKVTWALAGIVQKGSYDVAAFSVFVGSPCSRKSPCIDAIPNRFPLIRHDFTRPFFSWGSVPLYTSDASAALSFPVPFTVMDDIYGSGVKSWTLQRKVVGASAWATVQKGTAHHPTVQIAGLEGTSYDLRVVAVDRQGNKRTSSLQRVNVPFDDRHPDFAYTLQTLNGSVPGAFLGTTTSIAMTGTVIFTLPFDVTDICIVGGPTTGPASSMIVTAPTPLGGTIVEGGSTPPRDRTCVGVPVTGGTVVTMTSSSPEPFVLDGVLLVP
jgi:hypothetical protein